MGGSATGSEATLVDDRQPTTSGQGCWSPARAEAMSVRAKWSPLNRSGSPVVSAKAEASATVGDQSHLAKPLRGTADATLSVEPLP